MPTDPSGNYSLPPGYFALPGTSIRTEQHNPIFEDVAQGLSQRLMRDGRNGMVGALDMGTFPIRNLAPGSNPTDASTLGQGVPIGAVMDYALSIAPAGWLLCFGQALASDTVYPLLRAALIASGSPYGTSGGNPLLPDVRGRVIAGLDAMGGTGVGRLDTTVMTSTGLGGTGGSQTVSLSAPQNGPHAHAGTTGAAGGHSENITLPFSNVTASGLAPILGPQVGTTTYPQTATPNHVHTFSTDSSGSGAPHNNTQPTIGMNKIIKAAY